MTARVAVAPGATGGATHGAVDCRTRLRLCTAAAKEAHAATCPTYAAERARNLAHPTPNYGRNAESNERDYQDRLALDRVRGR